MSSPSPLLTPDAAAALLQVRPRTLTTWARQGRVPHVALARAKDGRVTVLRFELHAIEALIAKARSGAGA